MELDENTRNYPMIDVNVSFIGISDEINGFEFDLSVDSKFKKFLPYKLRRRNRFFEDSLTDVSRSGLRNRVTGNNVGVHVNARIRADELP